MAHFAQLNDDNIVTQVIVVNNSELLDNGVESESKGIAFCQSLFGGNWKQTSWNNNFRKRYAGIGYTYDPVRDIFIAPAAYPDWTLDENTEWQPPVPYPTDGKYYIWNQYDSNWIEAYDKNKEI